MNIKLLVLDVDGTLTDGAILYGNGNVEFKAFNVKDGIIIKTLPKLGIETVILTGRVSEAVERRARELGVQAIQGADDKAEALGELVAKRGIGMENCAYIGDDLNDYAAMQICGFKACPADAAPEIKGLCDYVSSKDGGFGAVRDVCEVLLKKCGLYDNFVSLCIER